MSIVNCYFQTTNPIQRTVHFALSLGGDTDTIATMAGSIAGKFFLTIWGFLLFKFLQNQQLLTTAMTRWTRQLESI